MFKRESSPSISRLARFAAVTSFLGFFGLGGATSVELNAKHSEQVIAFNEAEAASDKLYEEAELSKTTTIAVVGIRPAENYAQQRAQVANQHTTATVMEIGGATSLACAGFASALWVRKRRKETAVSARRMHDLLAKRLQPAEIWRGQAVVPTPSATFQAKTTAQLAEIQLQTFDLKHGTDLMGVKHTIPELRHELLEIGKPLGPPSSELLESIATEEASRQERDATYATLSRVSPMAAVLWLEVESLRTELQATQSSLQQARTILGAALPGASQPQPSPAASLSSPLHEPTVPQPALALA